MVVQFASLYLNFKNNITSKESNYRYLLEYSIFKPFVYYHIKLSTNCLFLIYNQISYNPLKSTSILERLIIFSQHLEKVFIYYALNGYVLWHRLEYTINSAARYV